jgi:homogentisate 1,2-dioxygenase
MSTSSKDFLIESCEVSLEYMSGFGNSFESESLQGALPQGRNSPQRCNYGLYAEQLSGSPFTAPRTSNERSWLYRIRPTVRHANRFITAEYPYWKTAPCRTTVPLTSGGAVPFGQFRWDPLDMPTQKVSFCESIRTITTAGDATLHLGVANHVYAFNRNMEDEYFLNADAEMLIIPQEGGLHVFTELGLLDVVPTEIVLIPRGMIFKISLKESNQINARGYICENYGAKFTLPERGLIGANCLANSRDFKIPVAAFEEKESLCVTHIKWCGRFFETKNNFSPLDVVAWHGNYAPSKYDLKTFSPIGAILFDHPDPSIFTVLTASSGERGTANCDFVIFPPRWSVAEDTFRPPWYHRNIMSEFMGLITGQYEAKEKGFIPGGMSLHNMMLPHGPDALGFQKGSVGDLVPQRLSDTLAFMFETQLPQQITDFAAMLSTLQPDYYSCWDELKRNFRA